MKRIGLFLAVIMLGITTACDVTPHREDDPYYNTPHFRQYVRMVSLEGSLPTDNTVEIEFSGNGLESIVYNYFEYSWSKNASEEEIVAGLTREVPADRIEFMNEYYGSERVLFEGEPETEYEVISLVTDTTGAVNMYRSVIKTNDRLPNELNQSLRLADKSWDEVQGSNIVVAMYDGTYVVEVMSGIFPASESADIPDEEIVERLTYRFSDTQIAHINNFSIAGGCDIYYMDLEYETAYEVVAYVIFEDGSTALVRDEITTGE